MDKLVRKTNALIMRIAKGDKNALGSLYELTSGYLLAMARAYVRDRGLAEDVVSETYLKAVRGAGSFDPKGNGLNWLFKIVRNTAFNLNSYENRRRHEDIEAHLDIADVFDRSARRRQSTTAGRTRPAVLPLLGRLHRKGACRAYRQAGKHHAGRSQKDTEEIEK